MSPLAEGADRLVAEEALTLGMPLTVPLPMPKEIYASDFATPQSKAHFEQLCAAAADVFELPLTPGNSVDSIREHGKNRARQYAQAGVFLCAHCHVLLALWDGKSSGQLGGTSQVVRFHHDDVMPGYTPRGDVEPAHADGRRERPRLSHRLFARPSRWRARRGVRAARDILVHDRRECIREFARCRCGTGRSSNERTSSARTPRRMPTQSIVSQYPLLTEEQAATLPPGLQDINQVFCAADWLAIRYQKRVTLSRYARPTSAPCSPDLPTSRTPTSSRPAR